MVRSLEAVVPTRPQARRANRVWSAVDAAIVEAGAEHPDRWPKGLLTALAQEHGVSVSHVHTRRRSLLPGVRSLRGSS